MGPSPPPCLPARWCRQTVQAVFGNWLEALFNLVLWRFWWCVILLCMSTRIQWCRRPFVQPTSQWESISIWPYGHAHYVPFMALDFKTDSMVDQLLEKTGGSGVQTNKGEGFRQNQARPEQRNQQATIIGSLWNGVAVDSISSLRKGKTMFSSLRPPSCFLRLLHV